MKFSVRQILASAAGAVIAALIASSFGVKGTIIGVAIGSAAATFGTAFVAQSLEHGQRAVKQAAERAPESSTLLRRLGGTAPSGEATTSSHVAGAPTETVAATASGGAETSEMESAAAPVDVTERLEVSVVADAPATEQLQALTAPVPAVVSRTRVLRRRFTWRAFAGTAAIVFVVALLFVTALELITGKPLAALFGDTGNGTTVKNIFNPSPSTPTMPPATTTTNPPQTTSTSTSTSTTSKTTTTGPSAPAGSTTTTTGPGTSTTTTSVGSASTTSTTGLLAP